jgi:hypothetical protein
MSARPRSDPFEQRVALDGRSSERLGVCRPIGPVARRLWRIEKAVDGLVWRHRRHEHDEPDARQRNQDVHRQEDEARRGLPHRRHDDEDDDQEERKDGERHVQLSEQLERLEPTLSVTLVSPAVAFGSVS